MDLSAVMDALGDACSQIDGLRSFPYWAGSVQPPAATVGWPDEYTFDQTMQRGSDSVVMPVVVLVGKADDRSSRDRLAKYAAGSGDQSIKQAIDSYETTAYDSARVTRIEFNAVSVAGVSYLAATFDVEIYAPGEAA